VSLVRRAWWERWGSRGAVLPGMACLLLACAGAPVPHGIPPGTRPVAAMLDSLDGSVQLVGPVPMGMVLLQPSEAPAVRLESADSALLRAVDGLTVRVHGAQAAAASGAGPEAAARFTVRRLRVLAIEGVPALDGLLAHEGGRWVLRSREGVTYRLPEPLPEPLQGLVGARIVWAGGLDAPPRAYAVLQLPPDQRRR
jgi:hypothetical protein